MNKVLIITYYWPPGSGAGVQRWLKFSKYLPYSGWEPFILTVDPSFATYSATDKSLEVEISHETKVYKTKATDYFRFYKKDKTKIPSAGFANNDKDGIRERVLRFIRGNFFIPDPRKGWNRFAFRKACEIIEKEKIKHIITTSPPHSTQLIGLELKKRYPDLKWIADLRDPWTDVYYYDQFYPSPLARLIDAGFEKQILKSADRIITVGKSLKDLFSLKVRGIADKIVVITNGYDEDDFSGITLTSPDNFTISYIGTLSDAYPIEGFLDAIEIIRGKGKEINLRFVGTISQKQKELILSKDLNSSVEFIKYVDHAKAIEYMSCTSALLLIIPDHRSNKSIITGKLFEYIATGKPIICIGPVEGDAAEIIKSSGSGCIFDYGKVSAIEEFVSMLIQSPQVLNQNNISKYSRKSLSQQIADLLES